jgi:ankyrin repeat protein
MQLPFSFSHARCMQPLHWAAHWSQSAAVDALLKAGADATATDAAGNTVLHSVNDACSSRPE